VRPATSYSVKRSTVSGGPYSAIVTGLTGTSYTDSTALNGTTYYYVVTASNSAGESANSSPGQCHADRTAYRSQRAHESRRNRGLEHTNQSRLVR
jgi:fibronectin type 3 domain-containing protein